MTRSWLVSGLVIMMTVIKSQLMRDGKVIIRTGMQTETPR